MNKTIPTIEEIKLATLIIDPSFSGRSSKEIATNAKELAPMMQALGYWDMTQPGQYFERDGKKHVLAGFTRHAAAEIAGIKIGYFVRADDEPAAIRTACIRTNLGRPVSQFEQGRIYSSMRDGTNPETAPKGTTILAPMAIADIAAEVGYTRQHVEKCISIFESSPEIGELIQEGLVASGIVHRAKQLTNKDGEANPGKQLSFLKAAISEAKKDGKETATMKHLYAVKADFAPLKVATNDEEKPKKADKPEEKKEPAPTKDIPQTALALGEAKPMKPEKLLREIIAVLESCDADLSAANAERYASALILAGLTFGGSPL